MFPLHITDPVCFLFDSGLFCFVDLAHGYHYIKLYCRINVQAESRYIRFDSYLYCKFPLSLWNEMILSGCHSPLTLQWLHFLIFVTTNISRTIENSSEFVIVNNKVSNTLRFSLSFPAIQRTAECESLKTLLLNQYQINSALDFRYVSVVKRRLPSVPTEVSDIYKNNARAWHRQW